LTHPVDTETSALNRAVRHYLAAIEYKYNIEMVISSQIKNIVETRFNSSTNCMQVALANLLFEIIMVRDGVLSLPTWVSCDFIDDVLSSVCV